MLLHSLMRTYTFLLLMMVWFLSLQAFAKNEGVRSGGGSSGSNQSVTVYASDKDQQVSLAKACIQESKKSDPKAWAAAFMDLRQKWVTTELACAPKQVMSKAGYACVGGTPDAAGNVPCVKKIDAPPTAYFAGNGQYEQFLKTHHNLVIDAQVFEANGSLNGSDSASKYRQQISSANCDSYLPEYYRAMTYSGDELEWHIGYQLKKEGKCTQGPSEPPIILDERSQKVADAVKPYTQNKGALERAGQWYLSSPQQKQKSKSSSELVAATRPIAFPQPRNCSDRLAEEYYTSSAFVYQYADRCGNLATKNGANAQLFKPIFDQLHASLTTSYNAYVRSQMGANVSDVQIQQDFATMQATGSGGWSRDWNAYCSAQQSRYQNYASSQSAAALKQKLEQQTSCDGAQRQAFAGS